MSGLDKSGMTTDEFANTVGTGPAPDAKAHANIPSAAQQNADREIKHPSAAGKGYPHGFESYGLN